MNRILLKKPTAPYTGTASVLMPGGAAEMVESKPGTYRVLTKRRKGFVKMALKNGLELLLFALIAITSLRVHETEETAHSVN